eukprot:SAG31_NODE_3746_length_3928_cov_4.375555_1_plen_59_part_00
MSNHRRLREAALRGDAASLQRLIERGKGCHFLVLVPTIRETRDFYREMQRTDRESIIL